MLAVAWYRDTSGFEVVRTIDIGGDIGFVFLATAAGDGLRIELAAGPGAASRPVPELLPDTLAPAGWHFVSTTSREKTSAIEVAALGPARDAAFVQPSGGKFARVRHRDRHSAPRRSRVWRKPNVTAFPASGMAGAASEAMGEVYVDAVGRRYAALLGQPILIFAATAKVLLPARDRAFRRDLARAPHVREMFSTGHDTADREAFRAAPAETPDLVGLALRGPKKDVDRAIEAPSFIRDVRRGRRWARRRPSIASWSRSAGRRLDARGSRVIGPSRRRSRPVRRYSSPVISLRMRTARSRISSPAAVARHGEGVGSKSRVRRRTSICLTSIRGRSGLRGTRASFRSDPRPDHPEGARHRRLRGARLLSSSGRRLRRRRRRPHHGTGGAVSDAAPRHQRGARHVRAEAARHGIDPDRIFLAGGVSISAFPMPPCAASCSVAVPTT